MQVYLYQNVCSELGRVEEDAPLESPDDEQQHVELKKRSTLVISLRINILDSQSASLTFHNKSKSSAEHLIHLSLLTKCTAVTKAAVSYDQDVLYCSLTLKCHLSRSGERIIITLSFILLCLICDVFL